MRVLWPAGKPVAPTSSRSRAAISGPHAGALLNITNPECNTYQNYAVFKCAACRFSAVRVYDTKERFPADGYQLSLFAEDIPTSSTCPNCVAETSVAYAHGRFCVPVYS